MEKKDKKTLVIFILLIISIIILLGINIYRNKKLENVDRKIEYIMGYTNNDILNKGESLFLQTIRLFNNEAFEYVLDLSEKKRYYSINRVNNYVKIINFSIATNNFSKNALNNFMDYKDIIYFENSYYMVDKKINDNNYIGSMLSIESYNDNEVIFKTVNYYCENVDYIGIIYEDLKCNQKKEEGTFKIVLENNIFKIDDIENFKTIFE